MMDMLKPDGTGATGGTAYGARLRAVAACETKSKMKNKKRKTSKIFNTPHRPPELTN